MAVPDAAGWVVRSGLGAAGEAEIAGVGAPARGGGVAALPVSAGESATGARLEEMLGACSPEAWIQIANAQNLAFTLQAPRHLLADGPRRW